MYCFVVTYARDHFAFCIRWSVCGKNVQYVVVSGWGVNELTKAMSNKQAYEKVAQCKRVVTAIDCPVIPANIR